MTSGSFPVPQPAKRTRRPALHRGHTRNRRQQVRQTGPRFFFMLLSTQLHRLPGSREARQLPELPTGPLRAPSPDQVDVDTGVILIVRRARGQPTAPESIVFQLSSRSGVVPVASNPGGSSHRSPPPAPDREAPSGPQPETFLGTRQTMNSHKVMHRGATRLEWAEGAAIDTTRIPASYPRPAHRDPRSETLARRPVPTSVVFPTPNAALHAPGAPRHG